MTDVIKGINWNTPEDEFDVTVWKQLVSQFWIPERFTIAEDLKTWKSLTDQERSLTMKVFAGLTVLDTLQGNLGAVSLLKDSQTDIETAWLSNIVFMEQVHAKSYSNIFMTLSSTPEINKTFRWAEENEFLQYKANRCASYYSGNSVGKRKVASVLLESFLFYSGFYLPIYWQSQGKLNNSADMIKAIIRDEAIHGTAIGYKYQKHLDKNPDIKGEMEDFTYEFIDDLYHNEVKYTQELYDDLGLTEDVKKFIRYNGNKALANLGYDPLFPKEDVNPAILNGISLATAAGDFFSGTNAYAGAVVEVVSDDDFDW